MALITFKLVQKTKNTYDIVAPSEVVLVDNIKFSTIKKARDYCRAFISSWNCSTFECELLRPLQIPESSK